MIRLLQRLRRKKPIKDYAHHSAYLAGYAEGMKAGFDEGLREGYNEGRAKALDEFKAAALKALTKGENKHGNQ